MGANPLKKSAAATLRKGVRALQQHGGLPKRLLEDHTPNHPGVGAEHVDTCHETWCRPWNIISYQSQGGDVEQSNFGEAHDQDRGGARLPHFGEGEKVQVQPEVFGGVHRL